MPSALVAPLIEAPGGGIMRNLDPRHVPDRAWSNARNVRFRTGGSQIEITDGYSLYDHTDPASWVHALWWYVPLDPTLPPTLLRITTTGALVGVGADRLPLGHYTDARDPMDVVTLDQYQDTVIWADGKEVLWWIGADLPAVLATAPIGKLVEIHKDRVLIGHHTTPTAPWRVAWSALGNPFDWTGPEAGDQNFREDSTGLTALKVLGDHVIVHKPNRLYRMILVGPPDVYSIEGIPADDGACSARSPISMGAYQYYMGRTNFYRLGSFTEPIGDAIWPEVQSLIDWPRVSLVYAYRRLEYDEICWKVPTRSTAQPSLTATFNFRDQTWTITDHDPGTCFTELPGEGFPLGPTTHGSPVRALFGQDNGDVMLYGAGVAANGAPIHAWAESKVFTTGGLAPARVLAVPLVATGQGTLMVSLRAAMDARSPLPAWPTPRPYLLPPAQHRPWVDVRAYGRLWQIRLDTNTTEDDWAVQSFGAATIPGGYAR